MMYDLTVALYKALDVWLTDTARLWLPDSNPDAGKVDVFVSSPAGQRQVSSEYGSDKISRRQALQLNIRYPLIRQAADSNFDSYAYANTLLRLYDFIDTLISWSIGDGSGIKFPGIKSHGLQYVSDTITSNASQGEALTAQVNFYVDYLIEPGRTPSLVNHELSSVPITPNIPIRLVTLWLGTPEEFDLSTTASRTASAITVIPE